MKCIYDEHGVLAYESPASCKTFLRCEDVNPSACLSDGDRFLGILGVVLIGIVILAFSVLTITLVGDFLSRVSKAADKILKEKKK